MSLKVYKASAGSGKTFQLALEYIALALQSPSPKAFTHILAVTFTNKATTEMKDRILLQLYNLAHGGQDAVFMNLLVKKLKLPSQEIEKRAARTLSAVIHDYDSFRVETIDSFFQSILGNLAHELRLSRTFRVDLDTDEIISKAVDRMLLSVGRPDHRQKRVTALLLKYMEEQIEQSEGWNVAKELKSFAKKNLFRDEYMKKEGQLAETFENEQHIKHFKSELARKEKEEEGKIAPLARQLADLLTSPAGTADPTRLKAYTGLCNYAQAILRGDYHAKLTQKSVQQSLEGDPKALLKKAQQGDAAYITLAEEVTALTRKLLDLQQSVAAFMSTSLLTKKHLTPLFLLSEIARHVAQINQETNTFMLAKTPDLLYNIVKEDDASFVFERAGSTFHHILIDEFQDTSGLQWENFKRLLVEGLGHGEECMVVGDVKQSIYRWRGGDWTILGNIEHTGIRNGKVVCHSLVNNFRSKQNVVEFNNRFFSTAITCLDALNAEAGFDRKGLAGHIYKDYEQHPQDNSGEGYVRLSIQPYGVEEEEIMEDIYMQIAELHDTRHIPYDKIAILVRTNGETQDIIRYFSLYHPELPFTSDEAFTLSASPAVMLIVHALKHLSEMFNKEEGAETDTLALEMCRIYANTLAGTDSNSRTFCPEDLNSHCAEWEALPLYELCHELIAYFGLTDLEKNEAGQSAYLFSFLDNVLSFVDEKAADIHSFITYWDETLSRKSIATDVRNSIYILTIHKSKGLEFHTVLLPFCQWPLDKDFSDDILWCDPKEMSQPFCRLPLIPISTHKSTVVKASDFQRFYNGEHLLQRIDSFNALYVALTRAKTNLLIWSRVQHNNNTVNLLFQDFAVQSGMPCNTAEAPRGDNGDLMEFGRLLPYTERNETIAGNPLQAIAQAAKEDTKLQEFDLCAEFRQSNRSKDFLLEATAEESTAEKASSPQQTSYIDRGKLLHGLLSNIETAHDLPKALKRLQQDGIIPFSTEMEHIGCLLGKRLNDPRVASWFDGTMQIYAECTLLERNEQGGLIEHRPDRVMKDADRLIVVDYKFGKFRPEYLEQVRRYIGVLRRMGHQNVRGYLWFVYSDELTEVNEEQRN